MTGVNHKGTVLITGASAGIGYEMAAVFAEHGHDLVLIARRKAKLAALARRLQKAHGSLVTVLPMDLADVLAPTNLMEELDAREIEVDVLVNNAGVLHGGAFRRMEPDGIDAMLALNVRALTQLCRQFVVRMLARGGGRILNVASIGAFQPVPSLAVYAATKSYVVSFSEALAQELSSHDVSVTAFCPGFTETDMMRDPKAMPGRESAVPALLVMQPDEVARDAYKAVMAGTVLRVPGLLNNVAASGVRLVPRWLVRNLAGLVARSGR